MQRHVKSNLGTFVFSKGLVVLTEMAGYAIAPGAMNLSTFLWAGFGTGLCSSSANAFNQVVSVCYNTVQWSCLSVLLKCIILLKYTWRISFILDPGFIFLYFKAVIIDFHTSNYMEGFRTFLQVLFTALSHKFLKRFLT